MSTPPARDNNNLVIVLNTIAAVIAVGLCVLYSVELGIGVGSPVGSWIGVFLWGVIAVLNVIIVVRRVRR